MNPEYLKDEGNALLIQKDQLNKTEDKLSKIDNILSGLQVEQNENNNSLDNMLEDMELLLKEIPCDTDDETINANLMSIENELAIDKSSENRSLIEELDSIHIQDNSNWDEYKSSLNEYALRNNIDLQEDPFEHLMSKSQQVELQKRIKEEFTYKNANCDKYDYMIAGTCGVIGGLVDILFVGAPGESPLGELTDKQADKITEKFAETLGWDKDSKVEKGKEGDKLTASAIGFLENKFRINYDQATTNGKKGTGGLVENLSASNHHLKSLGHSLDIIGLFFSILNQFTSTSSFINEGKVITIDTETYDLKGGNFIAKVFCGFANWFGHLMSDWNGSSGAKGRGGRGSGIPLPFYNLFQLVNVGEFGQHRQTFATVTTKVFENGYDFRHGMAMAIPIAITELLIRFMYTMKSRFYHEKSWTDSIPNTNIPELRRMLLIGHGSLCLIDGADAYLRSGAGADMVTFLLRTNLLAWTRFGQLGLKELNAWHNSGHIDSDAVDEYLDKELKNMIIK